MLPYQEDASSINNFSGVTNTVSNEISEDVHIFHQLFVNIDNPDSVALMKDVVLGERETGNFWASKNARYMQNVATEMKLGNGSNEVDVTNTHYYRTSLIQIVKYVHTFPQKVDVEYTSFLEEYEHDLARAKQEVAFLEASLANQKANISANRESFKSSFAEVLRIRK